MILKPKGKSVKQTLEEHLQSNCTLHLLSSTPTAKKECFIKECNNTSSGGVMVYVACDGCGEIFCLK
jgi:phage terminase large subunit GpA-like protein